MTEAKSHRWSEELAARRAEIEKRRQELAETIRAGIEAKEQDAELQQALSRIAIADGSLRSLAAVDDWARESASPASKENSEDQASVSPPAPKRHAKQPKKRVSPRWSPEDEARIMEPIGEGGDAVLSRELGRSPGAISKQRAVLRARKQLAAIDALEAAEEVEPPSAPKVTEVSDEEFFDIGEIAEEDGPTERSRHQVHWRPESAQEPFDALSRVQSVDDEALEVREWVIDAEEPPSEPETTPTTAPSNEAPVPRHPMPPTMPFAPPLDPLTRRRQELAETIRAGKSSPVQATRDYDRDDGPIRPPSRDRLMSGR